MEQELEIEKMFIEKFCLKDKRTRLNKMVVSKKGRLKFSKELHSLNFIDYSKFELNIEKEREIILERTLQYNDCYLLSENSKLDARRVDKIDVLNKVIASNNTTIIIFGKVELVHCEGEGIKNRWISKQ